MMNKRRTLKTFLAAALVALCLPALAAAQGSYDPWWGRDRDNRDSRDNRNSRDNRDGGRYGDYYGRYDRRAVRDSVRRLERLSRSLEGNLDRALDHSRVDGTDREDRINERARDFRHAADRLEDRFDDGRNLERSAGEARRVLQLGNELGRRIRRFTNDGRVASDWSRISQELRVIADFYGFRYNDDYGYNDRYPRNRGNNRYPW